MVWPAGLSEVVEFPALQHGNQVVTSHVHQRPVAERRRKEEEGGGGRRRRKREEEEGGGGGLKKRKEEEEVGEEWRRWKKWRRWRRKNEKNMALEPCCRSTKFTTI